MEAELNKTLEEGERIVAPTRRPDGTLRKPIRIRAGYVPQDEVAIYKSEGALCFLCEAKEMEAELNKTLKEGERILAPTRRPDGTLRKPIRIRAGYVPQDEVAIYKSKGALLKKEMESLQDVPPGYDPAAVDAKPKSKAAKRNERKKEKRQQAALEKGKNPENDEVSSAENSVGVPEQVESVMSQINHLALSANPVVPPSNSTESSAVGDNVQDIDKKIRALKKKIRLTEAQQQKTGEKDMKPEQLEKVAKLENWRKELKLLEDRKAELEVSAS